MGPTKPVFWKAEDGLEIQGFLTLPAKGHASYPLVDVHGGPVWALQNHWPNLDIWALYVARGYAVLSPNPRESRGRDQEFARGVHGDIGGADHKDILAGVDHLVSEAILTRLG